MDIETFKHWEWYFHDLDTRSPQVVRDHWCAAQITAACIAPWSKHSVDPMTYMPEHLRPKPRYMSWGEFKGWYEAKAGKLN